MPMRSVGSDCPGMLSSVAGSTSGIQYDEIVKYLSVLCQFWPGEEIEGPFWARGEMG